MNPKKLLEPSRKIDTWEIMEWMLGGNKVCSEQENADITKKIEEQFFPVSLQDKSKGHDFKDSTNENMFDDDDEEDDDIIWTNDSIQEDKIVNKDALNDSANTPLTERNSNNSDWSTVAAIISDDNLSENTQLTNSKIKPGISGSTLSEETSVTYKRLSDNSRKNTDEKDLSHDPKWSTELEEVSDIELEEYTYFKPEINIPIEEVDDPSDDTDVYSDNSFQSKNNNQENDLPDDEDDDEDTDAFTILKNNIQSYLDSDCITEAFRDSFEKSAKILEEFKKPVSQDKANALFDECVKIKTEANSPENKFPLLTEFNKIVFSWYDYLDSMGHYIHTDNMKTGVDSVAVKFEELGKLTDRIYTTGGDISVKTKQAKKKLKEVSEDISKVQNLNIENSYSKKIKEAIVKVTGILIDMDDEFDEMEESGALDEPDIPEKTDIPELNMKSADAENFSIPVILEKFIKEIEVFSENSKQAKEKLRETSKDIAELQGINIETTHLKKITGATAEVTALLSDMSDKIDKLMESGIIEKVNLSGNFDSHDSDMASIAGKKLSKGIRPEESEKLMKEMGNISEKTKQAKEKLGEISESIGKVQDLNSGDPHSEKLKKSTAEATEILNDMDDKFNKLKETDAVDVPGINDKFNESGRQNVPDISEMSEKADDSGLKIISSDPEKLSKEQTVRRKIAEETMKSPQFEEVKPVIDDINDSLRKIAEQKDFPKNHMIPAMISLPKAPSFDKNNPFYVCYKEAKLAIKTIDFILESDLTCPDFSKPENKEKLAVIASSVSKMSEELVQVCTDKIKKAAPSMDSFNEHMDEAEAKFSSSLAGTTTPELIAALVDSDVSSMTDSQATEIQSKMDEVKQKIEDAANSAAESLGKATQAVCDAANAVAAACSTKPEAVATKYKAMANTVLSNKLDSLKDALMNEYAPLDETARMYADMASESVSAMKEMVEACSKYSPKKLKQKFEETNDKIKQLKEKHGKCTQCTETIDEIKDNFDQAKSSLQSTTDSKDDIRNHFEDQITSAKSRVTGFGSNNPTVDKYNSAKEKIKSKSPSKAKEKLKEIADEAKEQMLSSTADSASDLSSALCAQAAQMMECLTNAEAAVKASKTEAKSSGGGGKLGVAAVTGQLQCNKGLSPIPIQIPPTGQDFGPGKWIVGILMLTLGPPFGGCTNSANPTAPLTWGVPPFVCPGPFMHTPFSPGSECVKVMMASMKATTEDDKCKCLFAPGGEISILNPGQNTTTC